MAKSAPDESIDGDDQSRDGLSEVKRKARETGGSSTPKAKPRPKGDDDADDPDAGADATDTEAKDSDAKDGDKKDGDKKDAAAGDGAVSLTISKTTLRKAAIALGALLLVALLVLGIWQWYSARQQIRDFDAVKDAAGNFLVTSIEYTSSDKVDKSSEAQRPLVTGKLLKELNDDRSEPTKELRDAGIKATAKIDSAAVESLSRDEATTLMVVTATGTSRVSPTPQKRTVVLRLILRREGGKWLVAESKGVGDFSANGSQPAGPQNAVPAPGAPVPGN